VKTSTFTIVRNEDATLLVFDAVEVCGVNPTCTVTAHPVEDGATVADHVQRNPLSVTMRGWLSETPFVGSAAEVDYERVQKAIEWLTACVGKTLFLVTRYGVLTSMVLVRWPYEVGQLRGLRFDLEFAEVVMAEAAEVTIPASKTKASGMASKRDAGEQGKSKDDPGGDKATEKDVSTLSSMLQGWGVL
jgi:hypothetical protein